MALPAKVIAGLLWMRVGLDLKSRRVQIVGSTRNPDAAFMAQAARRLTDAIDGFLAGIAS
jgi:hypothetical protein